MHPILEWIASFGCSRFLVRRLAGANSHYETSQIWGFPDINSSLSLDPQFRKDKVLGEMQQTSCSNWEKRRSQRLAYPFLLSGEHLD